MNERTFRKYLDVLGMNQVEFAKLWGINDRTARLWAERGVTNVIDVVMLNMLVAGIVSKDDIERMKIMCLAPSGGLNARRA